MEILIFILCIILVCGITVYVAYEISEKDSRWHKKRLYSRVWDIGYTCRKLGIKEVNIENKGCLFRVRVADETKVEKISYSSPYGVTDIYINDELVCKIHRLKNTFTMYITVEYAEERSGDEVYEIVTKAYKISKKKLNEYYKTNGYGIDSKSFYKN